MLGRTNEPGAITWEDLRSTDAAAARGFYAALFGYESDPIPGVDMDYATFRLPDEPWPLGAVAMQVADGPQPDRAG